MRKWFVTIKIQFSISAKSPQESCRVCVRQEMDPSSDRCQELLIKIWLPGKSCSNSAYVQKCGPCVWIPQGKHTKGIKKMCKKMPSVAHVPNGKTCMFHIYADWRPEIAMTVLFAHEFTSLAQMLQCYFLGPAACSALETPGEQLRDISLDVLEDRLLLQATKHQLNVALPHRAPRRPRRRVAYDAYLYI